MSHPPKPVELVVACPHCGQRVAVELADVARSYICPGCGQTFEMPAMQLAMPTLDYADPDAPDDRQDEAMDELDGLRIKQLATARRAAWRTRSWVLITAIGAGTGAAQLVLMSAQSFRAGATDWGVAYAVSALLALMLCTRLLVRARRMKRQIEEQSHHDKPSRPPDFSELSDGSQRWKNLSALQAGEEERAKRDE
jgi:DNA-directed RNA polymerase subunit RPC12/RpoP